MRPLNMSGLQNTLKASNKIVMTSIQDATILMCEMCKVLLYLLFKLFL